MSEALSTSPRGSWTRSFGRALVALSAVAAVAITAGCGRDNNPATPIPPFDPNNPNNPFQNLNVLSFRGTLERTNGEHYRRYLREAGLCVNFAIIHTCQWLSESPLVQLTLQNRTAQNNNQNISIPGSFLISVRQNNGWGGGDRPYQTEFYRINNNTGYEAVTFGFGGTSSYNAQIRVVLNGQLTDNTITGFITYRNAELGRFTLVRNTWNGGGGGPIGPNGPWWPRGQFPNTGWPGSPRF
jgi:hypothetical protein